MAGADRSIRVYQELAACYERQGEDQVRDRFLVLAADAAYTAGRQDEAERLREQLLRVNPHHLLKPFASWGEAVQSADFVSYVEGLRRTYPHGQAEHLLESLQTCEAEAPAPAAPAAPYRFQDAVPARAAEPRAAPPQPASRVAAAAAPPEPAGVIPMRPLSPPPDGPAEPVVYRFAPLPPSGRAESEPGGGAWLAAVLFLLVLAAGLALLAYTLVKPFVS